MKHILQVPINIKIRFGRQIGHLRTYKDRDTLPSGVVLYVTRKPDGAFRAWAQIPDGTLEQYKHDRPEIVRCDWITPEEYDAIDLTTRK